MTAPTLATLPPHILSRIVANARYEYNESPTWRLRTLCRALQEAVDYVLKPTLTTAEITTTPAIGNSIATPVCEEYAREDRDRSKELRLVNKRFADHLLAYCSRRATITNLTVEVRDDDDRTGWSLLRDHASSLEVVEIQVWDSTWKEAHDVEDGESEEEWDDEDALEVWERALPSVRFDSLTHLTVIACGRLSDHLAGMLRLAPNITELTVACHWTSEFETTDPIDYDEHGIVIPTKLKRLIVYGDEYNVGCTLQNILRRGPSIRELVINISDYASPAFLHLIMQDISRHGPLESLALHGSSAPRTMRTLRQVQETHGITFPNLASLVIEEKYWDGGGDTFTALLDDEEDDRPDFPALTSLSFVDDYPDRRHRCTSWSPPPEQKYHGVFDYDAVCELAIRFPSLRHVRWWQGHLDDPFDQDPPPRGEYAPHLKCHLTWETGDLPPHSENERKEWDPNDPHMAWLNVPPKEWMADRPPASAPSPTFGDPSAEPREDLISE